MATAECLLHDLMPIRGCDCPDIRIYYATNRVWDETLQTFGQDYNFENFTYGEAVVSGIEVTSITRCSAENVACNLSNHSMAFIFLHGYNNTFRSSALRLAAFAQQMETLTGSGKVAFALISWPSRGKTIAYLEDRLLSQKSSKLIGELLGRAAARMPGRVHILSHSLGVRLFWDALKSLPSPVKENQLGHLFWIAGDMSRNRFCGEFDSMQVHLRCQTSTSYYCHNDGALAWSYLRSLFDKRLGQAASRLLNKMHSSIKVSSEIALEGDPMFGHTYFTALPVIRDIYKTATNLTSPSDRELQVCTPNVSWELQTPAGCENFIVPLFKLIDIENKTPLLVVSHNKLRDVTKSHRFRYAGVASRIGRSSQPPFTIPIFDLRNKKDDVHVYTTSEDDRYQLIDAGLEDKGIVGYLSSAPSAAGIPRLVPVMKIKYKCGGTAYRLLDTSKEGVEMSMLTDYEGCTTESIIGYAVPPY